MIQQTLQDSLDILVKSADKCGFKFSSTKTNCIHFCRKRSCSTSHLTLRQTPLPFLDNVRFLGLTFDSKLTWQLHLQQLLVKCKKCLNLIKCLSHVSWGSDTKLLLTLLQSLVLSKLDYGCSVYSSARTSYLKQLDTIQTSGLRYCTGGFRTSPASSLQSLTGFTPLNLRRERYLLRYCLHVLSTDNHPNKTFIISNTRLHKYQQNLNATRPVGVRFQELIQSLDIDIPKFYMNTTPEDPPWTIQPLDINFEFTKFKKSELNPLSANKIF
jgi:hypothetical protein